VVEVATAYEADDVRSLTEGADAGALEAAARDAGTGFLPGTACSMSGGLRHCLRLSFAHYSVPEI
jgi:DNA-binding transcriptional MocR family regulator